MAATANTAAMISAAKAHMAAMSTPSTIAPMMPTLTPVPRPVRT